MLRGYVSFSEEPKSPCSPRSQDIPNLPEAVYSPSMGSSPVTLMTTSDTARLGFSRLGRLRPGLPWQPFAELLEATTLRVDGGVFVRGGGGGGGGRYTRR